jgi:Fe-S cluster assembly protein SufD
MSPLTPDAAAALPGPSWLQDRRAAAAARHADEPLPTTEEEVWRYSRVGDLDRERFTPADRPDPGGAEAAQAWLDAVGERAALLVVRDGWLTHAEVSDSAAGKGLFAGPVAEAKSGEEALGSVAAEPADVFGGLNDAFAPEPVVVDVPAGLRLDEPVVVVHCAESPDRVTFPRLVVRAGADSQVTVLDLQVSAPVAAVSLPVTEIDVGPAAHVDHVGVQDLSDPTWQLATQVSQVGQDGALVAATAALGGEYARLRTDCRLVGRGSTGDLLAVYFGGGDQTLDFRTFQDHVAPDTTSNLLFKGAVDDRSRSVYTGLIRVRPGARGTNAFQTNRNLKLSDEAWAESVPNLEIENNDVRCSHASAVGPIDADQRFYLESRGVRPDAAERLVVAGFFDEVLTKLPSAGVVDLLRARVAERLAAHG